MILREGVAIKETMAFVLHCDSSEIPTPCVHMNLPRFMSAYEYKSIGI